MRRKTEIHSLGKQPFNRSQRPFLPRFKAATERNPLVKLNPPKKFQVNLPIRSCITIRNTKYKVYTSWPSWILGITGFRKEQPELVQSFKIDNDRQDRPAVKILSHEKKTVQNCEWK
jgi:hypothetical protein